MAINKIVFGNNTLIDLTGDTITADKLAQGYTAHDASGAAITGTMSSPTDLTYKRWIYTNPSLINTTQIITILTNSWLAEHYDDERLEIMVTAIIPPPADDTSTVYYASTRARNISLGDGKSVYQILTRVGGSAGSYSTGAAELQGANPTTRGMLRLDSDGNLRLRVDANCQFLAGDYEIVARLLQ